MHGYILLCMCGPTYMYIWVYILLCMCGSTSCYGCVVLYLYIYIYIYISLQLLVVRIVDILKVSIYCNTLCAKHNLQVYHK